MTIVFIARVVTAVMGGYAFSASLVALASVALPLVFGLPRSEAVLLSAMLGFVLYLVVLLWAFSAKRLWRVCAVLLGGAAVSYGLVRWLSPLLAAAAVTGI